MAWTDETAAAMCLGLNDQQHGDDEKLHSADPYMLAAYCFDLTRKLHYLFDILYETIDAGADLRGASALLDRIDADDARVERAAEAAVATAGADERKRRDLDWHARAYELEQIIRDQYPEIRRKQNVLEERVRGSVEQR